MAVGEALRETDADLQLLYGGRTGGREEQIAREAGFDFRGLPGQPVASRRAALRALALLGTSTLRAVALLRKERVDVVVSTGGFASTAFSTAQAVRRGRLVLLEGNSVSGRTNRYLGQMASAVCTTFRGALATFPPAKVHHTGFPVRSDLTVRRDRRAARESFGLQQEAFTLLIVGGSQGAKSLNEAISAIAPRLVNEMNVQILHQTGPREKDTGGPALPGWVRLEYITDMPSAYAAADLAVTRAGASTISELALQGTPAILVPYPFAHANHQEANARELADEDRAVLMPERELQPEHLLDVILALKDAPERREGLTRAILQWARPDAARDVAAIVMQLAGRGSRSTTHTGVRT